MISFRVGRPGINLFSEKKILFFLWLFLLVFPKGGFKIAGIPLTWGYFLLILVSFYSMCRRDFSCNLPRAQSLLLMIPFQLITAASFLINGIGSTGFAFSFIINFFFFSWAFFIFLSEYIESIDLDYFFKIFKIGVFFIVGYGIILFIFKLLTGKFIEIPLLTVNLHDFGEIEKKHIDRGGIFKLISTYNNGNIYGICLLMILPLYLLIENSKWRKILAKTSLVLSLSRTVWIGLILSEILFAVFISKKTIQSYVKLIVGLCCASLAIFGVMLHLGANIYFIFDRNLGGRREQLAVLSDMSLFPNTPFSGVSEMTYLSMLSSFGFFGLISYVLCLAAPILIALSYKNLSIIQKAIICGLASYLFISISDGALLLIPILVFYWFLSSLLLRRSFNTNK